jgi:hypothetical protein
MALNARTGEAAVGVVLTAFGVALAALSARMPGGTLSLPGPGFVPMAVGALLAVVGAACALTAWRARSGAPQIGLGGMRAWGALGTLGGVALAFEPIGAPISLSLGMVVLARLLGGYGVVRCLLFGLISSAVAWLVFTRLLGVGLPAGLLPL